MSAIPMVMTPLAASPHAVDNNNNKRLVSQDRRNDYDVTDSVQVSNPAAVRDAVRELHAEACPGAPFDKLWLAFHDFERLFTGAYPGYLGCDTTYHDMQHTLDMTLALARLVVGHEKSCDPDEKLGERRTQMAIITSLFHDSGYIRHKERDRDYSNGAEFTMHHVSRSADFLRRYLPAVGLSGDAVVSSMIVHFTGYELDLDRIELEDPRDAVAGHLLGTADLIAQMADRCYLEKCRDRLYREFVLGGIAVEHNQPGQYTVRYESGMDLLRKTPQFYRQVLKTRLQAKFNRAYRYIEPLYDGQNPYVEAIRINMSFLARILETGDWSLLRRNPPTFVADDETTTIVEQMVDLQLARIPRSHLTASGFISA